MSVWRALPVVALLFSMSPAIAEEVRNPLTESETWEDLKYDVVGDAEILDGSDRLAFEAPFRAHDAATVPITIKEIDGDGPDFVRLTLIVDENPAPIAAEFSFGPAMGEIDLEARVRVDAYTNVRAIAETADGEFYMVGRYVRASGGCSAPSLKDSEAALANIGKMRLRLFDLKDIQKKTAPLQSGARREAQIMMRHPNYSGFQRNQLTHLFVPAHFVHEFEVHQGDQLVFSLSGGISISEDPSFRFKFVDNGAGSFDVRATDTDGEVFERNFPTVPEA